MRIAVLTASGRRVGGLEMYVDEVASGLAARGHQVGLWTEADGPPDRAPLSLPAGTPRWSVEADGAEETAEAVRAWRPDVIFAHGTESPALEEMAAEIAPVAFVAHAFHATCVSGAKAFGLPVARPCGRRFGPGCLAHYYPRRCGGLNPVTALVRYRRTARRLSWVRGVAAVITLSDFIRREYLAHGVPAARLHCLPYGGRPSIAPVSALEPDPDGPARLLYVGRLEPLKGAHLLIRALPRVATALGRPVHLTVVGDGRRRRAWERAARRIAAGRPDVDVRFAGWLDAGARTAAMAASHLLVVPSVWPEPFGLVGLEAAAVGVPAAAFAVGGIADWLKDGVSGRLAPADPPTAPGLAGAITWCLSDSDRYRALRASSRRAGARFPLAWHVTALERVLSSVADGRRRGCA